MPNPLCAEHILWYLNAGAYAAIFVGLLRAGIWRQWWGIALFCAFNASKSLVLMELYVRQSAAAYFYLYWYSRLLSYVFALVILHQVLRAVVAVESRRVLRAAMLLVPVTAGGATFLLSRNLVVASHITYPVMQWAFVASRCVSVAMGFTFAACLLFVTYAGFGWPRRALWVATGIGLQFFADLTFSAFTLLFGISSARVDSLLHQTILILASAAWLRAFVVPLFPMTPNRNKRWRAAPRFARDGGCA